MTTQESKSTVNIENVLPELRKPFHPSHVTWKPQAVTKDGSKAMACAYADVRAYQNRLDEICGMDWAVTFTPWGERVVCHLTINGVTRSSTGEGDAQSEKSEIAGTAAEAQAFKRACSMFGLGRYLYEFPAMWAEFDPAKKKFTAQGEAKLIKVVVEHYKRHQAAQPATGQALEGVAVETLERLRDELDRLGEQWPQVLRHNVERMTGSEGDATTLTVMQLNRMIDGMKKLQGKRVPAK